MTKLYLLEEHKKVLEQIVEGLTGRKPVFSYVSRSERTDKFRGQLDEGQVPILIPSEVIRDDKTYMRSTEYVEFLTALQAGRLMYGGAVISLDDFSDAVEKLHEDGLLVWEESRAIWDIEQFFERFKPREYLAREIFEIVESARVSACLKRDFIGYREMLESVVPEKFKEHLDGYGKIFRQPFDFTVLTLLQHQLLLGYPPQNEIYSKQGDQNSIRAALKKGIVLKPFVERVREVLRNCHSIARCVLDTRANLGDSLRVTCLLHKIISENSEKAYGSSLASPRKLDGIRGFDKKEFMVLADVDEISKMKIFSKESIKRVEDLSKVSLYPEWDSTQGRYIPGFGAVDDLSMGQVARTITPNMQLANRIRQEFSLIKPDGRAVLRKQRSGELDYERYVEYQQDVAAGITPDERIYKKVLNRKRDVAALILVDMSGSTNRWVNEQTRIIDVIAEAVYYLSCGVSALDDLVGVFGYSSDNRKRTYFYKIADFGEARPDNEHFLHKLEHITGQKQNHDGTAIRHATRKLMDTGRKNKILIHISDGEPEAVFLQKTMYADEKILPVYQEEYAWQDVGRALSEARANGVLPVCIRVNDQKAAGLERVYGTQYRILPDPVDLKKVLCSMYKDLIS